MMDVDAIEYSWHMEFYQPICQVSLATATALCVI